MIAVGYFYISGLKENGHWTYDTSVVRRTRSMGEAKLSVSGVFIQREYGVVMKVIEEKILDKRLLHMMVKIKEE